MTPSTQKLSQSFGFVIKSNKPAHIPAIANNITPAFFRGILSINMNKGIYVISYENWMT